MAYATLNQIITALEKLVTTGKLGNLDNVRKMILKHPPTTANKITIAVSTNADGSKEITFDGGI